MLTELAFYNMVHNFSYNSFTILNWSSYSKQFSIVIIAPTVCTFFLHIATRYICVCTYYTLNVRHERNCSIEDILFACYIVVQKFTSAFYFCYICECFTCLNVECFLYEMYCIFFSVDTKKNSKRTHQYSMYVKWKKKLYLQTYLCSFHVRHTLKYIWLKNEMLRNI